MRGKSGMQRKRTGRIRGKGRFAAAAAAVLLLSALLCQAANAAPDLSEDANTITVKSPSASETEDAALYDELANAGVVLDFYQVAPAIVIPDTEFDYDAFVFGTWNSPFSGEPKTLWETMTGEADDAHPLTADDVNSFTQSLAKALLGTKTPVIAPLYAGKALDAPVNVAGGMYLIVAHGSGDTDYVVETTEGGVTTYTTTAKGASKTYRFAPMLVTVPARDGATPLGTVTILSDGTSIVSSAEVSNTADREIWNHNIEVTAKIGVEESGIPIRIVKHLPVYDTTTEADFIFEVYATRSGKTLYNDVAQIKFTAPGDGVVWMQDAEGENILIPQNAQVTVTETYSGATYTVDAREKQAVLYPNTENPEYFTVEFTNTYQPSANSGGSAVNRVVLRETGPEDPNDKWTIERVE